MIKVYLDGGLIISQQEDDWNADLPFAIGNHSVVVTIRKAFLPKYELFIDGKSDSGIEYTPAEQRTSEINPRAGGAFLAGAGLFSGKFFIYDVIVHAQAGWESVNVSMKGTLISVVGFSVGLWLLLRGRSPEDDIPNKKAQAVFVAVTLLAVFAIHWSLLNYLKKLGYAV